MNWIFVVMHSATWLLLTELLYMQFLLILSLRCWFNFSVILEAVVWSGVEFDCDVEQATTLTQQNDLNKWLLVTWICLYTGFLLWPRTFYICQMWTLLGLILVERMGIPNPHLDVSNLSCMYIDLANVIALPATTFTFQMPHWHGTVHGERNRDDKPVLLRLSVLLSWCSLHRLGNTKDNTLEQHCGRKPFWIQKTQQKVHTHSSLNNVYLLMPKLCNHKTKNISTGRLCGANNVKVLIMVANIWYNIWIFISVALIMEVQLTLLTLETEVTCFQLFRMFFAAVFV